MDLSRRKMLIAGAALPVAGLLAAAHGQDRPVVPTGNIPVGPSEDPLLAAQLLIAGRIQTSNSQLAARQTQSGEVRAFAEAEIAEHRLIQSRLSERGFQFPTVTPVPAALPGGAPVDAIAGVPGNPPSAPTANRPVVPQPGTRPAANATPAPVVLAPPPAASQAATPLVSIGRTTLPVGESRMILIDTQVGDQCIATFQREVAALTGLAFDKAYIGNQLFEHFALQDKVTVFRRHASPVMLPVLDEARPVIERHIATLKAIMARLDATR
jgi:predicted outer membrane protein